MARTYHHGDLRAALITAGLGLIEEQGADDLSLRELARRVGVSATAVYRHFPDKAALMAALAREALERLAAAQRAASERAGGGAAGFGATGAAYVRFARDNPGLFRLVFAHPASQGMDEKEDDAMAMLRAAAVALAPEGTDPTAFALRAWSLAHGLAMLMLDGQVEVDDAMIDRVIDVGGWVSR
ncbi:TetR/AcrR family transcriptional regulator [uncultured Sphingomonas sp.]|uniref:TetR/AcrR family transcriptional regulator n=1 Tax=uncultured Sphingomonas sp. TaxID=158754 RepID=UPI0026086A4C|nr:TetR/AcrR family transcriptional regulator [uncultured Sphingomonas sp.]